MSHEFTLGEWIDSLAQAEEKRRKEVNYERAWKEPEGVIGSSIVIYDFVFEGEGTNSLEKATINTLTSIDSIMEGLRKKYSKEEESTEEDK